MANIFYEVLLTFDINSIVKTLVFRSGCQLEQAVQLANSLWLSTNNDSIQISVCEDGKSIPVVIYHCRDIKAVE